MNNNILCEKCIRDCKQPPSAKLVSCARYKSNIRNLELFDSEGEVSGDVAGKRRRKKGEGKKAGNRKPGKKQGVISLE